MSALRPAYRMTTYASRGVDPTETTPLTPIAGAAHSDAFRVATVQGLANFKPYLGWPKGARGKIDAITTKRTAGQLSVPMLDMRTGTGNALRWVTTFLGDINKRSQLKGLKVFIEEALDWDPVGLTGTWTPYFTGRIRNVSLVGALEIALTLRDLADDFNRPIFLGPPHPSVTYAFRASVMPVGLPQDWGTVVKKSPRITGVMAGRQSTPGVGGQIFESGSITIDTTIDPWLTVVTKTMRELRSDALSRIIVLTNLSTGQTGLFRWYDDIFGGTRPLAGTQLTHERYVEMKSVFSLEGAAAALSMPMPANGTAVAFYVVPVGSPTKALPFFVNDIHPIQWMADIADGKFSLSTTDATLRPIATRDTSDGGPWARLLADPSFGTIRPVIDSSIKANEVYEKYCGPLSIGYDFDGAGNVYPIDLRRKATTVPVALVLDADLVADDPPAWDDSRDLALVAAELLYYRDRVVPQVDLRNSPDSYPDVPPTMLTSAQDSVIVLGDVTALRDVGDKVVKLDCKGIRVMEGEVDPISTQALADVLGQRLAALGQEKLAPFAGGGITGKLPFRRASSALSLIQNGSFFAHQATKLPDPATNARGGPRLALCTSRDDQGIKSTVSFLDLGAISVAVQPAITSAAVAADDPTAIDVVVVANAAGDAVEVWYAVTAAGTTVCPDERDARWTLGGSGASGIVRCRALPKGNRIWIRALSRPPVYRLALPSVWTLLPGTGYVDLAVLAGGSGLTVSNIFANRADLSWSLTDIANPVEIYATAGAVPGTWTDAMRVATKDPGTKSYRHSGTNPSTAYAVGIRTRDGKGGVSAMATQTYTSGGSAGVAPRPAGITAAVVPSA